MTATLQSQIQTAPKASASSTNRSVLQRKCSCGGTPGPSGECAECRKKRLLQTKLTVNEPGDKYEQEADRIADRVMRMPASIASTSAPINVQRLEGGGNSGTVTAGAEAPSIVRDVLNSSGRPLDGDAKGFMESRFGHDFSRVRVHTDARSADSARAVQARAYTVGRDVVFGAREYSPGTQSGRQLLAHELTHVVQQSSMQDGIQAAAHAPTTSSAVKNVVQRKLKDIPDYQGTIRSNTSLSEAERKQIGWTEAKVCRDTNPPNDKEAIKTHCPVVLAPGTVVTVMQEAAGGAWVFVEHPAIARLGGQRYGYVPRVFVEAIAAPKKTSSGSGPTPEVSPPKAKFVCGPYIADEVEGALDTVTTQFDALDSAKKLRSCQAIGDLNQPNPALALSAWDIMELYKEHVPFWMTAYPDCATPGADPSCDLSVQIDDQCHYAGSVNYVLFGTMFKLCNGIAPKSYDESWMETLITLYKGTPLSPGGVAANYESSKAWAKAGYNGWPTAAAPHGDRLNCDPSCGEYLGGTMTPRWAPYLGQDER